MSRRGLSARSLVCAFYIVTVLWIVEQSVAKPIRDGLLLNGNFKYPPKPSTMKGTVVTGSNSIPFWQTNGFVEYISAGEKQRDMVLVVPNGDHGVRLGNEAKLSQRVEVKNGSYYSLTFSVARTCAQNERLNVSVPPKAGDLPMETIYSSNGWDSYAWAFWAASNIIDITLHNPGVEDDPTCGPIIDDIAIKQLFPPSYVGGNLVKNGNFEEGPLILRNSSCGVLLPPNMDDHNSPLPSWIMESLKAVKYIDALHYTVPQGKRAIELLSGMESATSQMVTTLVGKPYVLSFLVGDANNTCSGSMRVEAFAGRENVQVPYKSKGTGGFKRAKLTFTATSARTRIAFFSSYYHMRSDDSSSLCGPVVDDVKLLPLHADSTIIT